MSAEALSESWVIANAARSQDEPSRYVICDWNLPCCVTDLPPKSESDMKSALVGVVDSEESGLRIVQMFGGLAKLVRLEGPSHTLLVKVGVVEEHRDFLERLVKKIQHADNKISLNMIQESKMDHFAMNGIPYSVVTRLVPRPKLAPAP